MKRMQFVETTQERYDEHVFLYQEKHGGRMDHRETQTEPWTQLKIYHNPTISDIGQRPQWTLIALAHIDRKDNTFSNYFILTEVEMGTKTTQIGLNGLEVKE